MKTIFPVTLLSAAEATAIKTYLQSGFAIPVTYVNTSVPGVLSGVTPSVNFPTSSALTFGAEADNANGDPSTTAGIVNIVVASPPTVSETLMGVVVQTAGNVPSLYIVFDRPLVIPAGLNSAQLSLSIQEAVRSATLTVYDNSAVAFVGS